MLNKILNSKYLPYLGELILPTILSSLFAFFVYSVEIDSYDYYGDEIIFAFSSLLFFIVLVEWFRRRKYKNESPYLIRYLYVPILVIAFLLGIWYVNMLAQ
ncbi:hypothetical protein [Winogradskyella ouciana]|uniref:hypothetical protein n=1 Tax=Winogradskyella ouciana TaxID=2608631 RepID=UPI003D2B6752